MLNWHFSSNQIYKNEFESNLLNKFLFGNPQILIVEGGGHWRPLERAYLCII